MPDQHYEWAIIGPDGRPWAGLHTMGPSGPRDELAEGRPTYKRDPYTGEDVYDPATGEPVVESVRIAPAGSFVGRRIVSRSPWEKIGPKDDQRAPDSSAFIAQVRACRAAAKGDSNDTEIEALEGALSTALGLLGYPDLFDDEFGVEE